MRNDLTENSTCANCGSTDRVAEEHGGVTVAHFCGACGCTWGFRAKPVHTRSSAGRRQPEPSGFGRVSDGTSLNQRLKNFGIKGHRKSKSQPDGFSAKPFAAMVDNASEKEWSR